MASTVIDVKTESSAPTWDNFPAGLRVMVVDDDELCLKLVEKMLQKCNYEVTVCNNATQALETLRRKTTDFDLVLSDVYMPDMDGFKLLETIGLELDLPVIMMSSNGETTTVLRGVTHGAVDFLIKPVRIEELRNLWQHVIRKRKDIVKDMDSDEQSQDKDDQAESSKKRKEMGGSKDGRDMMRDDDGNAAKKPRVVWSVEMHQQFVNAVNQLGIDKAVPKKILELMNVEGLTRENVASHLQKYRLYLKRVAGVSPGSSRIKGIGPSLTAMAALAHGMPGIQPNPPLQLPQQGQQPQQGLASQQQQQQQQATQNSNPPNPNGPPSIPQQQLPNPNGGDPLSNAFAAGLLTGPQGGGLPFSNPNLSAMSAAQAANIAQAANLMGAMNVMGLGGGLAGAMGLTRLGNMNSSAGPNAGANMAMQLGMSGMGTPQLNAMGMGLNPGLGLGMPNMQGMAGAMGMAQMSGLAHLGMVGMGGMNGNSLLQSNLAAAAAAASNHMRSPNSLPNMDPSSLLAGPSAAPFNPPHSTPMQPAPSPSPPPAASAAAIAQELAMMESTAFDFPTTSAPAVSEPPPPLESSEFNSIFNDSFPGPATTANMLSDLPKQEPVPMDDFLSFLLKDGNLPSEA